VTQSHWTVFDFQPVQVGCVINPVKLSRQAGFPSNATRAT